jgi:ribosomal-protein-alanine N-acetyltransferase
VIRPRAPRDLAAVATLERDAFTTPWTAATFRRLLDRPGAELWVVEERGRVVAYAVLWCILDQGELANIAVEPGARGQGIGGRLLDHLVDVARERGVHRLFLEVRESNEAAHRLYDSRGFRRIGTRRDYYDKPREDARVLELRLGAGGVDPGS